MSYDTSTAYADESELQNAYLESRLLKLLERSRDAH